MIAQRLVDRPPVCIYVYNAYTHVCKLWEHPRESDALFNALFTLLYAHTRAVLYFGALFCYFSGRENVYTLQVFIPQHCSFLRKDVVPT